MTVTLGVDPHKASHTVVATDQVGRQLTQATSRGTRTSDHQELIGWARQRWPEPTWAVEDCRHVTARLLGDLLAAGELVVLVPPRLMAKARQAGRVPGKSDPIDALAVARAALQEPNPPRHAWTGLPGRSSCWSATARTWSPSAPGSRTGCAGTCTTWIPSGRPGCPPGTWSSGGSWTSSRRG
jgi:Transposase